MDCDLAFEFLTDPLLQHSPELAAHLHHCPRCRQMREVLAPALTGLDEVPAWSRSQDYASRAEDGPLFRPDLPVTGPAARFLSPEAIEVAEQAAQRLTARSPVRNHRFRRAMVIACSYFFAIGAGALLAWGTIDSREPRQALLPVTENEVTLCSRVQFGQIELAPARTDAHSVILSCVACHFATP